MPTETPDPRNTRPISLALLTAGRREFRVAGDPGLPVSGIQYDSRKIAPGDLFVALKGGYFDGHDYVSDAVLRGAVAVMTERELAIDLPQVVVGDTRAALAVVAARVYGHPSRELEVIGVTGTDGKTTTSYLIESILDRAGFKSGVIGTIGIRIGERILDDDTRQTTPESLDIQRYLRAMCDDQVKFAIVEATSHGLDLHRLDETRFASGAVTNVTHEHLDHHGSIAAYRRAKGILFERVGEAGGGAVINVDDPGAREMMSYATGANILTYSAAGAEADLRAVDVQLAADGARFGVEYRGRRTEFATNMLGQFNVANALCAVGVGITHDISPELSKSALAQTVAVPGRMQAVKRGQPFSVVVDYAHSPDAIEKVLTLLRTLTAGRLIIVMGSAGERDREKRPLQGAVAARLADYSVFTTEDPRFEDAEAIIDEIADGARSAGADQTRYRCIVDRREAVEHAISAAQTGDCVLLAGKGHERSIIWGLEKRPWDEAAVAAEVLESLGFTEVQP